MDEYRELLKLIVAQESSYCYVDLDPEKKHLVLDLSIYDLTDRQIELLAELIDEE